MPKVMPTDLEIYAGDLVESWWNTPLKNPNDPVECEMFTQHMLGQAREKLQQAYISGLKRAREIVVSELNTEAVKWNHTQECVLILVKENIDREIEGVHGEDQKRSV